MTLRLPLRLSPLVVAAAFGVACSSSPGPTDPVVSTSASAKVNNRANLNFVGQHMHNLVSGGGGLGTTVFPARATNGALTVGSLRTWDSNVGRWANVEPTRGTFDFAALDLLVDTARANGADVLHTVGGVTPTWASARPKEACPYGIPGCSAEPASRADWVTYLTALFTHFKGRIAYYEVWNEPSFDGAPATRFYTGTPEELWALHKLAFQTLRSIDPAAKLIGPAFVSMAAFDQIGSLDRYLAVTGHDYALYTDVVGFHFYQDTPERTFALQHRLSAILAARQLDTMPRFNTEGGYASADLGGNLPHPTDPALLPAYVARSYLLGLGTGLERSYYYAWDGMSGRFADDVTGTLRDKGIAEATVAQWIEGASMGGCYEREGGVIECRLRRTSLGVAHVIWRALPGETTTTRPFPLPADWGAASAETLTGAALDLVGKTEVPLGAEPVLVKATRAAWRYDVTDPVATFTVEPARACKSVLPYRDVVLADLPYAYYRMTTPVNGVVPDVSGHGRDARTQVANVAPAIVRGALVSGDDGAFSFSDPNTRNPVEIPRTVNPFGGDFTVEAWMSIAHYGHHQIALLSGDYLTSGFRFAPRWRFSDDAGFVSAWTTESGGGIEASTSLEHGTSAFHHYVLRYSAARHELEIFVDGVLGGRANGAFAPPVGGMFIGAGGGFTFDGAIDEVALYDRALPDARILAHRQAGSGLCSPAPIER